MYVIIICILLCPGGCHESLTALFFCWYVDIDAYNRSCTLSCPKMQQTARMRKVRTTVEAVNIYMWGRDKLTGRKVQDVKSQGFAFPDFLFIVQSKM